MVVWSKIIACCAYSCEVGGSLSSDLSSERGWGEGFWAFCAELGEDVAEICARVGRGREVGSGD